MHTQVWDRYFASAFPDPLAFECCRLREQLQERERPGEKPPFASTSNFDITDIIQGLPRTRTITTATAAGLDAVLDSAPPKGVRIISLASDRKISPLEIASPVAARLFEVSRVRPEFLRVLLFFGGPPLESEPRNSFFSLHEGEDGEFSISYKLVYYEKNRGGAWVARQIGIYHHRDSTAAGSGSLFIVASGTRQTMFVKKFAEQLATAAGAAPNPTAQNLERSPWALHTMLLSCYSDGWRDYFRHLGTQYSGIADRAMGARALRVDDGTVADVKTLRHLYDLSLFSGTACAGNAEVARALLSSPLAVPAGEARSLGATAAMLESLSASCGVLQRRIENATDLVGHLMGFHYQAETAKLEAEVRDVTARLARLAEENRDLTRQLRGLAEGTSEMTKRLRDLTQNSASDGAIVSVVTVVSAVYLPGSFVATIFGMNFFDFDEEARRIAMSPDFWIFMVLWIGLMMITAAIFWGIYRWKSNEVSWPWKVRGGGKTSSNV